MDGEGLTLARPPWSVLKACDRILGPQDRNENILWSAVQGVKCKHLHIRAENVVYEANCIHMPNGGTREIYKFALGKQAKKGRNRKWFLNEIIHGNGTQS